MIKVMFLKTPKERKSKQEVFAYFPERFYNRRNGRTHFCYLPGEGEGPCDDFYALHDCEAAKEEEYRPLMTVMNGSGYADIEVIDVAEVRNASRGRIRELQEQDFMLFGI